MKRAVVLVSGGLDSATTLAIANRDGFRAHALSFDYGQRHKVELEAAKRVARLLGAADHRIAQIDLRIFGGSALTGDMAVPKDRETKRNRTWRRFLAHPQLLRPHHGWIGLRPMRFLPAQTDRFSGRGINRSDSLRATMKRFLNLFVLTQPEQRLIIILVLLLVGAAWL